MIPLLVLLAGLVAGSASTRAAESARLRPLVSGPPIEVTLSLRPHNAALLARLAATSSARAPLSPRLVRQLFLPTAADLRAVRTAMADRGLVYHSHKGLTLTFSGSPAAVAHAFDVSLVAGERPDGTGFRRPLSQPRPPASIAGLVQDVGGLNTEAVPQPLLSPGAGVATPGCSGPAETGGYLPAQLGSSGGYGHDALIDAGFDGSGERIAFVEFSAYKPSDVAVYQACFGLSVPVSDVAVGATASDRSGSAEVELDVETAIAAAPGLDHAYVYMAPQTTTLPAVLNAIVADAPVTGVRIVSDSWGICEPLIAPARVAATNQALQLAAVSGITVLAASGDSGSFDCSRFLPVLAVDDPAAQPFATGVGGTTLHLKRSGDHREVVWDDAAGAGGGGLSRFWQRPSWQAGVGVVNPFSNGHRELPDVALHSSPIDHGHIVYCSTAACGHLGWTTFGGTSAAAPLLAGIVADMNQYSRAHGGQRLGYANPFLYDRLRHHRAVFRDVVLGDNHVGGKGPYPATPGYDLATGIGSVRSSLLAVDLAGYVASPPAPAVTMLTAAPSGDRVIRYGTRLIFHGRLTDGGGAVSGERVYLQGGDLLGIREWPRRTGADGRWSVTLSRQIVRRMTWRAVFLGSQTRAPAVAGGHTVFVIPPLTASAGPPHRGPLITAPGETFRFSGQTLGVLDGRTVVAEYRRSTGTAWHRMGAATVHVGGRYARLVSLPRNGSYLVRWHYFGGPDGQWMSGLSRPEGVVVV